MGFGATSGAERLDNGKMNVLTIVVDDLGWADLGCYGSSFHLTPHIDRLAAQSLRFTDAYAAAPVCSPTRAALLTGKYPARLDMTIWHEGAVSGGRKQEILREAYSRPNLPLEETTLAELFRRQGFVTAHVGKWHLGTAAYYPEAQGFDVNIGGTFWGAPATFFHPFAGAWNASDPQLRYVPGLGLGHPDDYLPDRLTDETIQLLKACQDRPFLINLWYYTVHSPIEAPSKLIAEAAKRRRSGPQRSPEYAAMVQRMDHNVGRILDALHALELAERTVVILTSDNGGVDIPVRGIIPTSNHPLRSGKGTLYEGGVRVPLMIRWPGRTSGGNVCRVPTISQDLYATLVDAFDLPAAPPEHQDGQSLAPLLANPSDSLTRESLYWHFPHYYPRVTPCSAVRNGDWKLLHFYETNTCQLFNLATDLGEQRDVSAQRPQLTRQLKRQLQSWRQSVGANGPYINR